MRIRFWGTRGSLPVSASGHVIREKVKQALRLAEGRRFENDAQLERFIDESLDFPTKSGYGGDSSCVQIEAGEGYMICDMGTGLRRFAKQVVKEHGSEHPQVYHFFMSHLHWDHIMGFPFFTPAYIPGNTIRIYGGHHANEMEDAFRLQQSPPYFPVYWDQLGADITFTHLEVDRWYEINSFRVKIMRQAHQGGSFGYRFEKDGKSMIFATDAEHKQQSEKETEAVIDFFRDADFVIFDATYSLVDMITIKEDWGHSSNIVGVDLCLRAKVKHYCMFHHEPALNDEMIYTILQETKRYETLVNKGHSLKISTAYDDLVIDI
ncbi:MAG: MBL fold metallo-hydrolase [Deltaproteobacteria bacterium]|nr:MBL fold metallo-hydrolase [Deltaproteobacteria bacterium]